MIYGVIAFMMCFGLWISAAYGGEVPLTSALAQGCSSAVELALSLAGGMCFWSGICEIMERSQMSKKIESLFSPLIKCLFGGERSREFVRLISQNITANFLGLGNLATASGLQAAKYLYDKGKRALTARLIVLNTASIQLLPTTLCTVRAALGAKAPYDIMPHVWISSVISVVVGLTLCVMSEGGKNE